MPGFPLRLTAVAKTYRPGPASEVKALDGVSFDVAPGTMVAVTGPSGSGKSTLLHMLGGMDAPDRGSVLVGDVDVATLPRRRQAAYRRSIGFVFQRFHLLPGLSALDNVVAPVLPYRTDFDKSERGMRLLEAVDLGDRAAAVPATLSGGQQQRVAIARALVNRPGLLLADEPTGSLDSTTGAEILDLLARLRAEHEMTVVVATHDPLVAARCDRIVSLRDGRVEADVQVPPGVDPHALLQRATGLNPHA